VPFIRTRCGTADDFGVARLAREAILSFAQNNNFSLRIGADDPRASVTCVDRQRSPAPSGLESAHPRHLHSVNPHVAAIGRVWYLRFNRSWLTQQQAG